MHSVTAAVATGVLLSALVVHAGITFPQIPTISIGEVTGGTPPEELENRLSFLQWFLSIAGSLTNLFGGGPTDEPEPPLVPPEKCEPCTCGLSNTKNRIVGGTETQVNQYPWIAKLFYNGRFYCAGSLINSRYVLTASHCLHGFDYRLITVRLLEHDANSDTEAQHIDRKVLRVLKHSRYSDSNFNNDIALIRLAEDVELKGSLRPVCLPPSYKNFTGQDGTVAGWGTTSQGGAVSPVLMEVTVPILSNTQCRKTGYGNRRITDNMLCAGVPEGKKDSCQGDSGGPLVVRNGTFYNIVGVVSWGDGCARPNYPGVYSRVNRYLTWLSKHTIDSCPCQPPGTY
ncbi:trypsin-1 [Anabrus simplex]|uniref:trypsin-1 n=1 Tax=Anabrus simplex TaxID=316456 RepID=UPI0034DD4DF9